MNCMNCGSPVTRGTEYCAKCGFHVLSQQKAIYLSKLYYNQGLEKASVRDLSGAISCLKQSLKFSKLNIQSRNLLGLVYFETGEVVAALCEWVISKNIMSTDNLAIEYIDRLQSNPAKLEVINRTVNKYNLALSYCRQGSEDLAAIQLKKLLSQNPRLIKGYHLLALLQIKSEEYTKARRTLKKALRIDKTNTTTLRFLREVDEQTGMTTDLSGKTRKKSREESGENTGRSSIIKSGNDLVILPPAFRESSMLGICINLAIGFLIGAAALWFMVIPARTQQIYDSVNQEILDSGGTLNSQAAQLTQLEERTEAAEKTASQAAQQVSDAQAKSTSNENLLLAYQAMMAGEYDTAAVYMKDVYEKDLSENVKGIYQTLVSTVGTGRVDEPESGESAGQGETDNQDGGEDYDSGY